MNRIGALAVASAAVLWAFGGTFARTLIDRGASPLEITEARAWIAAAGLGVAVLVRRRARGAIADAARPPVASLVALGLAIAVANYTYYLAIAALPVAVAIVVQYTAPAIVVLWLAAVARRPPGRTTLLALGLALAGVALLAEMPDVVATGELRLSAAGLLAAGASAVAFATYMVVGEHVRARMSPVDALFRGFVVASLFWLVVQTARGRPDTLLDGDFIPGIVLIGFVATLAPFFLFIWGLGHVDAARAGIVSTLEPLSAAVLAWIWLDQSLSVVQLLGALMVIGGIVVVQRRQRAAIPDPAPLE